MTGIALRRGLVAEYRFDNGAADTSGNGRHGVVHGATLTADRFGNPDHAYHFDGINDYIEVTPPPSLTNDAISVSVWARWDARDFKWWTNCVVSQDDGNDDDQSRRVFQLSTFGGHIAWHRMIGARDPIDQRRLRSDRWYHIAAAYEKGEHRLYVDGVLHDAVKHSFWTHGTQPLHIGRKGSAEPFFFFKGTIDDLRVYDRALNDAEIDALAHEGGWEAAPVQELPVPGDPLSGQWGRRGIVYLDLRYDGEQGVTGQVMSGSPDNMADIATGTFDRARSRLRFAGTARHPNTGIVGPFSIDGTLDEGELTVRAVFEDYSDNVILSHSGIES